VNDNGLSSCSGNNTDNTGETITFYIEFPNDLEFHVYENPTGGNILGIFEKVI